MFLSDLICRPTPFSHYHQMAIKMVKQTSAFQNNPCSDMQPRQFHLTPDMFRAGTHMLCMWDDWLWGLGSSCELNMGFGSSAFHLKSVSCVALGSDGLPSLQIGVRASWVRRQFVEMALKQGCWTVFEVMASQLTRNTVRRWGDAVFYLCE